MKKTGNRLITFFTRISLLLLLSTGAGYAQSQISVETTVSENQVFEGERIALKVEVISSGSRNVTRPTRPDIDGFRFLSNFPATSTNYSNINGVASMTYSYTWQIEATEEGVHQIPPIVLAVDGEVYQTDPVTVTVLAAQLRGRDHDITSRPDVFLKMNVSDDNPVRGQQIIAELAIYFKADMDLSSYQVAQGWVTEGFWQEDLNKNHSARAETMLLDGVRYRRAILRRHALFPTRAGELTLQPYKIQAIVRHTRSGSSSHDFFSSFRSSVRNLNLESDEITVNVRDLPPAPDGIFINAVGLLNVTRTLSSNSINLGESVEIITEISGSGNIALVTRPDYDIPMEFDVYRPQETTELDKRHGKVSGKKTFRDVIIGRKVGSYEIPETKVAMYNNENRRYETITLPAMSIQVVRDPNAQIGYAGNIRFNVTPVTGIVRWSSNEYNPVYNQWWVWAGLLLPLLIAATAYRMKSYHDKMKNDLSFSRKQTATGKAANSLKMARQVITKNDLKTSYSYIHQAISGFITDRLGLPPSGHSDEQIANFIRNYNGSETLADEALSILTKCSTIRFAPPGKPENVMADIHATQKLIDRLNKNLL